MLYRYFQQDTNEAVCLKKFTEFEVFQHQLNFLLATSLRQSNSKLMLAFCHGEVTMNELFEMREFFLKTIEKLQKSNGEEPNYSAGTENSFSLITASSLASYATFCQVKL